MDELKKCPYCGSEAIQSAAQKARFARCSNIECSNKAWIFIDQWQIRPIEDALRKQLDLAKEAIKKCPLEINKLKSRDLSNEQANIIGGMLNMLHNTLAELERMESEK